MKSPVTVHQLPNGASLVLEETPGASSAGVSVSICKGSRDEPAELGGASHFIEHLLFKGTHERDLYELANAFNLLGGGINAFTSNEMIRLHTRVISEDVAMTLELLADIVWNSAFPVTEVERERGVILEEIAEYNDSPEDLCFEQFLKTLWQPHPVGRPVLGEPEQIESYSRNMLFEYWEHIRSPQNMIISVAGGFDSEEVRLSVEKLFGSEQSTEAIYVNTEPAAGNTTRDVIARDLEQVQFCVGLSTIPRSHPDRFAFALLDTILGGGMGSRLFNEIRERRGLAYTIASSATMQAHEGYLVIYGSTLAEHIDEVLLAIRTQTQKLAAEAVSHEELETAKKQVIRALILAMENSSYRSSRNADRQFYGEDHEPLSATIAKVEATTRDQIAQFSKTLFEEGRFTETLVGPL